MSRFIQPNFPLSSQGPLLVMEGDRTSPMAIDAALIENRFREHGALLLRGFDFDVDMFRRFAERLCKTSVFNESPNRAVLDPNSAIQSVDLGVEAFPLHPELSREPWRPDACLFACFDPPESGGETTVCDGVGIVRRLPPGLIAEMLPRQLVYLQQASSEALEYWLGTAQPTAAQLASPPPPCPYFFIDAGTRIIRGFSRAILHKPMFHEGPAFGNFLLFARDYLGVPNFPELDDGRDVPDEWVDAIRDAAGPITHSHAWRRGDILILDNSRYMHGRRAILDPEHRTIASYFGYVDFAPPNPYEPADPPWRRGLFKPPSQRVQQASA